MGNIETKKQEQFHFKNKISLLIKKALRIFIDILSIIA
jgi:hypothetical protein